MEKAKLINPLLDELPSHYADSLGLFYTSTVTPQHKKDFGQYFTPLEIAGLMGSYSKNTNPHIRMLDPGCGTAILTCALIESLVVHNPNLKSIELIAYETDNDLIPYSEISLTYLQTWLTSRNVIFTFNLITNDFILDNADCFNSENDLFSVTRETFDIIISNPPYFKLSKEDLRSKAAHLVVNGQPNIYSIFMAVAAKLLSKSGELIFITPRSFASGSYFKVFREFFFQVINITNIHLFVSRKDTFNRDNVLQELVIMKGIKNLENVQAPDIIVSSSFGLKDINQPALKTYHYDELIDFRTNEKILHLPVNDTEEQIVNLFKSWSGNLNKYQIQISTGPVVAFRAREYIRDLYENGNTQLVPLFWLHNVEKMILSYPVPKPNKGQYIVATDGSGSLLLPNRNYLLLRRFSSKDDKSRLIAAPYFSNCLNAEFIGVENKVNYIYRPKGHLDRSELVGLCALLNSNLFDAYFRTFNGNVNVSATELREMPLPPLEIIKQIGNDIILSNDFSMKNVNNIINNVFELNQILVTDE